MRRIEDGLPDTLSKQRRWQIRKEREGRCQSCGARASGRNCRKCRKKYNAAQLPKTKARQRRLRRAGLCGQCGKRGIAPHSIFLCAPCLVKARENVRKYVRLGLAFKRP